MYQLMTRETRAPFARANNDCNIVSISLLNWERKKTEINPKSNSSRANTSRSVLKQLKWIELIFHKQPNEANNGNRNKCRTNKLNVHLHNFIRNEFEIIWFADLISDFRFLLLFRFHSKGIHTNTHVCLIDENKRWTGKIHRNTYFFAPIFRLAP